MKTDLKRKKEYKGYALPELISGSLIKRYKRFLADVELEDNNVVTAHCPNSGSMKGCATPGSRVFLSRSNNPKRKLSFTWELLETPDSLVGINTQVPNKLVKEAIENNLVSELGGYDKVKPEIKTSAHTRLDLLLENDKKEKCYVEIKNCTLAKNGKAMFPDAVTVRGKKHLLELEKLVALGHRGVIFFLIQRMDIKSFTPAGAIDPEYANTLKKVAARGVEIIAMDTIIDREFIRLGKAIPVSLDWENEKR